MHSYSVYLHSADAEEFWEILGLNIQSLTLFVFCIHFTLFSTKNSKKISTNPFFSISHEPWDWRMTNYRHVLCLCLCLCIIQRSYAFTPTFKKKKKKKRKKEKEEDKTIANRHKWKCHTPTLRPIANRHN